MICASIDRGVWERFRRNSVPRGGGKKPAGRVGRRFDPGSCTRGPVGLSAMGIHAVSTAFLEKGEPLRERSPQHSVSTTGLAPCASQPVGPTSLKTALVAGGIGRGV